MDDQRYHVTLATPADGTVMNGWWSSRATGERKFTSWIGSCGAMAGARVTLAERLDDGVEQIPQTWPEEA
ncbi:hypothetical protein ABZS88_46845 [Streptomyces sp. NPDC005480]|uniref:hypothetical protein n=1 Tax=Streptomyces sp. NPDC005480 TaxID=3154880 RepID=UPI0033AC891C